MLGLGGEAVIGVGTALTTICAVATERMPRSALNQVVPPAT